jgi:hypothetical protein
MSEIRKLVIVGDPGCGKVSIIIPCLNPPAVRGPMYQGGYADGTLLLRRNLDLLVDRLCERNFP